MVYLDEVRAQFSSINRTTTCYALSHTCRNGILVELLHLLKCSFVLISGIRAGLPYILIRIVHECRNVFAFNWNPMDFVMRPMKAGYPESNANGSFAVILMMNAECRVVRTFHESSWKIAMTFE